MRSVFDKVIEPGLERIPVLEVSHEERHQGRHFIVKQTIKKNVFTEFDRKLSRHLAATTGAGFPAFSVTVQVSLKNSGESPRSLASAHHASVPHALKGIAERAYSHRGRIDLQIHHCDAGSEHRMPGATRTICREDITALEEALKVSRHLGEAEFLDISGDFDVVMVSPPGEELSPVVMHLQNGGMMVPCNTGTSMTPFECPIHGFATHASGSMMAQSYLAKARHGVVAAKEAAVLEFRATAETRILSFDRALGGRQLTGHRRDAADALIERLKTGLGETLNGLSEDARITALDWSAEIASGDEAGRTIRPVILNQAAAAH